MQRDQTSRFALRQVDQARGDLDAIHDELEFLRQQLARLPTRGEMLRLVLAGSGLAALLIELFHRGL
jgi:hypothetical protein